MDNYINIFAFITNYFNLLLPLPPILLLLRSRLKEIRVTHFDIPSPKYFTQFSSILLPQRLRLKEMRVIHFENPSPKYFAPFSPILF